MYLKTMEDPRLSIEPDVLLLLDNINRFLTAKGVRAYLVGGMVRDMLLGRDTADIDIAVSGDGLETARDAADALGGRYVPLDAANGTGRVVLIENTKEPDRREIDFTTLQGEIKDDLARRDFTVDAMAVALEKIAGLTLDDDIIIDPFDGRRDLEKRIIRAVSDTVFQEDAARLVRAVRLAAELGFTLDPGTEALMRRYRDLVTGVAGERVREELLRVLATSRGGRMLAHLGELGILTALIPELAPARGVSQPKVHVWDVYEHSLKTVTALEFLLREGDWEHAGEDALAPVPWTEELRHGFDAAVSHGSTHRSLLKLAALLHDIAKPQTRTIEADGRARFLGHPQEGAATAAAVMERLRFSSREIKLVEMMVRQHLRPTQLSQQGLPTRRAIYRYFRDTGEAAADILFLSLADHLATRGKSLDAVEWQGHAGLVAYILNSRSEDESLSVPPKLVDGRDIMAAFNLEPGPGIGRLLETLREAQAAGEVTDRRQALEYIGHLISEQREK